MGLHGRTALIALGAGINLSTYGIGVWSENVLMTNGAFVGSGAAALSDTYLLFATLGLFIALLVRVGVAARTGASNRHYLAWGLGPMLCAALLFLSGLWNSTGPLVALAAFCTGWSFSCQTLFWMISLSFEPAQMSRAFPLELAFAAAINALFVAGFTDHQDLFLGCGLLLSTGASVILTRMDAALDRPAVVAPALSLERSYLPAFRAFAEVLFCVVALQTIAPTLNYMGLLGALSADQQQIAVTAAKIAAAGILTVVLRFSRAPLYSIQVFKVVTPILILLLFVVPFAPGTYLFVILVAGSCLHFIVTNSLFCIDAVTIARRFRLVFEFFYGIGFAALMACCTVLEHIMPQLLAVSSSAELMLVFGVFFCVYALSMAFVRVRRRRRDLSAGARETGAAGAARAEARTTAAPDSAAAMAPRPNTDPIEASRSDAPTDAERVRAVQQRCGLSDREAEIVLLIMHGRNVPAIAEELVLSPNTVRTHVKRIYRACDVHSRQDLIALCEGAL